MSWLVRFCLIFVPVQYEKATDGLLGYLVAYKNFWGKRYTLGIYPLPPEHWNCRTFLAPKDKDQAES